MEGLSRITVFIKYGLYALIFASAVILAMDTPIQAATQDTSTMVLPHEYTMNIQMMCNGTTECYYAHCRHHCNPSIGWPACECSYFQGACFSDNGGYCNSDTGGGGDGGGPSPE